MVVKPEQHDIDAAGERILRDIFEGFGWVVNKVQRDYRVDFNVQVFVEKSPDGTWLHCQLKSHSTPDYSADTAFISESLELSHAKHFALELKQPMFLAVAEVNAKRLFWHCPQLDASLIKGIKAKSDQDEITVRVPTANELPQSAPELLKALRRCQVVVSARTVEQSSTVDLAASLHLTDDPEKSRIAFQSQTDALKLERIAALYHEHKFDEARKRTEALLLDPDATVETRFWASVQAWSIEFRDIFASGQPQNLLSERHLEHAISLQRITYKGPKPFKFYSMTARRAAELEILAHENFSLAMLHRGHLQHPGNIAMLLNLYARRVWLARAIAIKYNQCVRLARIAATFGDSWLVGRSLSQLIQALPTYLMTLRLDGNTEEESAYLKSAFQICRLAAEMATRMGDPNGLAQIVLASAVIVNTEGSEIFKWAKEAASTINDSDIREDLFKSLSHAPLRWKGQEIEGDIKGDSAWQALQNIAAAIGLDISDESSPIVIALRIAVKDDTWDRVLIECEHLLVNYGAVGPMASEVFRIFNMKTAASKVVHCTLHNFHHEAKDLDSAYVPFKAKYCADCKDCKPRPAGWRHSGAPTREEMEFIATLAGTPFGMRFSDTD